MAGGAPVPLDLPSVGTVVKRLAAAPGAAVAAIAAGLLLASTTSAGRGEIEEIKELDDGSSVQITWKDSEAIRTIRYTDVSKGALRDVSLTVGASDDPDVYQIYDGSIDGSDLDREQLAEVAADLSRRGGLTVSLSKQVGNKEDGKKDEDVLGGTNVPSNKGSEKDRDSSELTISGNNNPNDDNGPNEGGPPHIPDHLPTGRRDEPDRKSQTSNDIGPRQKIDGENSDVSTHLHDLPAHTSGQRNRTSISRELFDELVYDPDRKQITKGALEELRTGLAAERAGLIGKIVARGGPGADLFTEGKLNVDVKAPRSDFFEEERQLLKVVAKLKLDPNMRILIDARNLTPDELEIVLDRAVNAGTDMNRFLIPDISYFGDIVVDGKVY